MRFSGFISAICSSIAIFLLCAGSTVNAQVVHALTAISIRDTNDHGCTILTFSRSQRFYKLPNKTANYKKYMKLIHRSLEDKKPVLVLRKNEATDTISGIKRIR